MSQFIVEVLKLFPELKESQSMLQIIDGLMQDANTGTDTNRMRRFMATVKNLTAHHPAEGEYAIDPNPLGTGRPGLMEPTP